MYLVDTNIISELTKSKPNLGVIEWAEKHSSFVISAITVEEVYFGLGRKNLPRLWEWFQNFFHSRCTIIPVDKQVAKIAGEMRSKLTSEGENRTQADMLIAATALVHDLTIVTRNITDFNGTGVRVLNPFDLRGP